MKYIQMKENDESFYWLKLKIEFCERAYDTILFFILNWNREAIALTIVVLLHTFIFDYFVICFCGSQVNNIYCALYLI